MQTNTIFILMMIICLSAIKLSTIKSDDPKYLPNSDNLLKGYSIFTADPSLNSGKIGPGFEAFIFDTSYSDKSLTSDRRFEIPNNYQLNRIQTCDFSMTSTEITGKTSFKNTFEAIVGVTETVKGTAFSASANF